jgi:hypothetical protein
VADPLTDSAAVTAALLRPLTAFETSQLDELISQAENALRTTLPSLDTRLGRWDDDPALRPATAIDPVAARRVLADVIARRLSNPERLASESAGDGPFTQSRTYAGRGGDGQTPGILITAADLAALVARPSGLPSTIKLDTGAVLGCAPPCAAEFSCDASVPVGWQGCP